MSRQLPYITIYKGDFLRSHVSACSLAAQGLWLRLMFLMHDSERVGYLCVNSVAMNPKMVAVKCGLSLGEYETLLAELTEVNAFASSKEGIFFSPELVAQEQERAANAERQKRFKEKQKGNGTGNGKSNGEVTPEKRKSNAASNGEVICSSSSSSSSEESTHTARARDAVEPLAGELPAYEVLAARRPAWQPDQDDYEILAEIDDLELWRRVVKDWRGPFHVPNMKARYDNLQARAATPAQRAGPAGIPTDKAGWDAKAREVAEEIRRNSGRMV